MGTDVISISLFVLAATLFLVSSVALVRGSLAVIHLHNRRDATMAMAAALVLWVLSVLAVAWGDGGLPTIDLW